MKAVQVACEHNNGKPCFIAMTAVLSVIKYNVRKFAQKSIEPGETLNTYALNALKSS